MIPNSNLPLLDQVWSGPLGDTSLVPQLLRIVLFHPIFGSSREADERFPQKRTSSSANTEQSSPKRRRKRTEQEDLRNGHPFAQKRVNVMTYHLIIQYGKHRRYYHFKFNETWPQVPKGWKTKKMFWKEMRHLWFRNRTSPVFSNCSNDIAFRSWMPAMKDNPR